MHPKDPFFLSPLTRHGDPPRGSERALYELGAPSETACCGDGDDEGGESDDAPSSSAAACECAYVAAIACMFRRLPSVIVTAASNVHISPARYYARFDNKEVADGEVATMVQQTSVVILLLGVG